MKLFLDTLTTCLLWAAGLIGLGLVSRLMVTLFCFGYGC
jgi:hypothetical protein